jgi:hypothetical protein
MTVRKATAAQKETYWAAKPVYPLYGYIKVDGQSCAVEDLKGDPDLRFEIIAPKGFHFFPAETHTLLCENLADLKERATSNDLVPCTKSCNA